MTPWTTERVATLREYVALRLSAAMIGDRLGVTRNTVIGQCRRHKLQLHGKPSQRSEGFQPRAKRLSYLDIAVRESQVRRPVIQPDPGKTVGLLKLRKDHCREVLDGVGDDGLATFCGARKIDKISYCAFHAAKNFNT